MSESKRDRDRATEAFRRWARLGCPAAEEIAREEYPGGADLMACCAVFDVLRSDRGRANFPGREIMEAVRRVYMFNPRARLGKAEITGRVTRAAVDLHADERTVYRWLGVARKMWAEYRFKTCQ